VSAVEAARRSEALRDSQATLRQVESILSGLGEASDAGVRRPDRVDRVVTKLESRRVSLKELVSVLLSTYMEITEVIHALRQSRGILEQAAMERIQSTHRKLTEVSTATEMATTGMLDGLDRSLALLDRMEPSSDADKEPQVREQLREELHAMMNLLQFQDITAQQLGSANGVLEDIEGRLVQLRRLFDLGWLLEGGGQEEEAEDGEEGAREGPVHVICDPGASAFGAEARQALADEIFR